MSQRSDVSYGRETTFWQACTDHRHQRHGRFACQDCVEIRMLSRVRQPDHEHTYQTSLHTNYTQKTCPGCRAMESPHTEHLDSVRRSSKQASEAVMSAARITRVPDDKYLFSELPHYPRHTIQAPPPPPPAHSSTPDCAPRDVRRRNAQRHKSLARRRDRGARKAARGRSTTRRCCRRRWTSTGCPRS